MQSKGRVELEKLSEDLWLLDETECTKCKDIQPYNCSIPDFNQSIKSMGQKRPGMINRVNPHRPLLCLHRPLSTKARGAHTRSFRHCSIDSHSLSKDRSKAHSSQCTTPIDLAAHLVKNISPAPSPSASSLFQP